MDTLVPPRPVTPKLQEQDNPSLDSLPPQPHWSPITPQPYVNSQPEPNPKPEPEPFFDRTAFVNKQQTRLFRDPRAALLLHTYEAANTLFPNTYYSHLAPQGAHILRYGQAAQTSEVVADADFLAVTIRDLDSWLQCGSGGKVMLLRDRPWSTSRPSTSSSTILQEAAAIDPDMVIDVQDSGQEYSDEHPAVRGLRLQDAIVRMNDRKQAPINALNIECKEELLIPPPLARHCRELVNATRYASSRAVRLVGHMTEIGKKTTETIHTHAVDIQSCIKFQINGQAGAFSSWHMDNMGVYTWVTLEPTVEYSTKAAYEDSGVAAGEYLNFYSTPEDESVLKLWAIIVTSSPAEDAEARAGFGKHGEDWMPNPKWIRVLALTRFDTLIMPPGTIHAPITVTDCLFRGGMVLQKRFLQDTMQHWKFCISNPHCTNEAAPKQTRSVIDYLERVIVANPREYGFGDDFNEHVFKEECKRISAVALSCRCKSGCNRGSGCSCFTYGQRCGAGCHKGSKCSNPCGVHETGPLASAATQIGTKTKPKTRSKRPRSEDAETKPERSIEPWAEPRAGLQEELKVEPFVRPKTEPIAIPPEPIIQN
ncbi:uncharacterized protein RSE6_01373 [Rhynchosporium secalis]|uniref:JmjC domain-containing protein n=1 Tax=Rhynchosporium secalis TaxID=38038 RepID=A0A1E1LXM4_RHYSE|nr:uncharacterized protein RSE6_01373 [Rhynchosporium secalis]